MKCICVCSEGIYHSNLKAQYWHMSPFSNLPLEHIFYQFLVYKGFDFIVTHKRHLGFQWRLTPPPPKDLSSSQLGAYNPSKVPNIVDLPQCKIMSQDFGKMKLSVKFLKEARNHGFDPSLRGNSMKNSLARCVLESILKLGWNFLNLLLSSKKHSESF